MRLRRPSPIAPSRASVAALLRLAEAALLLSAEAVLLRWAQAALLQSAVAALKPRVQPARWNERAAAVRSLIPARDVASVAPLRVVTGAVQEASQDLRAPPESESRCL
jgi:hypothetical protein